MRFKDFKNILFIISLILIIEGLSFLLCIPYAIYYHESFKPFYLPALVYLAAGFLIYSVSNKRFEIFKSNKERIILLTFSWLIFILTGTLPYLVSKTIPSFVDVLFETTSGLTTTGSSILTDIEIFPKSILFWRSLTQWLGGIVTVIMVILVMPSINIGGYKLFSLESSLKERPVQSFRAIVVYAVIIYLCITVAQVILLSLGGMNLFESLCHTFGTVSTGCFSPKNGCIAAYSPFIQYIMVLFMFFSGAGYIIYYLIIAGKFRTLKNNEEFSFYSIIILSVALLISGILYFKTDLGIAKAFREGFFQVVSVVTTTGYATADYLAWPDCALLLLLLFLFVGGCTGSSSGGIKMSRFLVLIKYLRLQFKYHDSSLSDSGLKYNGENIGVDTSLSILTFTIGFGVVFMLGTTAISLAGLDLKRSAFLSLSALSTFGHNLNLSHLPGAVKMIISVLMFTGRLEIYSILIFFSPSFYNIKLNQYTVKTVQC